MNVALFVWRNNMEEKKEFITGDFEKLLYEENPGMKPITIEDKHAEIMDKLNEISKKLPFSFGIRGDAPSVWEDIAGWIMVIALLGVIICGIYNIFGYFIKWIWG